MEKLVIDHLVEKDREGSYYTLPFSVPEGVRSLTVRYSYPKQGNVIDLHAAVALEHPQALYHFAVIAVKLQVGPKHRERLNGKLVHRQVLGLQGAVGAASGIDFRQHDAEVLLCFRYAGGTAHARIGGQRNGDALRKEAHATGGKSQDEMYEFPFHIFE